MNVCRDKGLPGSLGHLRMNHGSEVKTFGVRWDEWKEGRILSVIYQV